MILRTDDTDVQRNTDQSHPSIFDGQSGRLEVHKQVAETILQRGMAYRDFSPADDEEGERSRAAGPWFFNAGVRELSAGESNRHAAVGEKFVLRFRIPSETCETVRFTDSIYGEQSKGTADIEDFALLRSDVMPTYHLASRADDADLKISDIIRGQDHLSNTFKHILIFEAEGATPPTFAHLALLVAPDGARLSKRRHGPVVSVNTYPAAGFLPHAYVNFLCLPGWSPKDNRERMKLDKPIAGFSFEGIHRGNAVVNFRDEDPIDPKALWLNSQHLRALPIEILLHLVKVELEQAGLKPPYDDAWLKDFAIRGRAYFADDFTIEPDALARLDMPGTREALRKLADKLAANPEFTEARAEADLRALARELGVKASLLINGARAALTEQPVGSGAFRLFVAIGRDRAITRLRAV